MNLNPRKIGFDEEFELKEEKFQMREEPVDSKIDEPDEAQEFKLEGSQLC